jgi:hypothetical protein
MGNPTRRQQLDRVLKNREEIRRLRIKKFKVPSKNYSKNILRIHYVRYADDWVIFTNCNLERCEEIKKQLTTFLDKTLNLTLDPVKTKITNLNKDYINFLAFSIGIRKFPLVKRNSLGYLRRVAHNIIIRPDRNRINNRLIMKLMAKTKLSNNTIIGISVPFYTHFEINDIITKFNSISRGLYNYYLPIVKPAYLTEFGYIINFSCFRTICRKYDMSIRKLNKIYGGLSPLTINVQVENTMKPYTVLTHTQLVQEFNERDSLPLLCTSCDGEPTHHANIFDTYKLNYRSRKKLLFARCIICGAEPVQIHHVRSIKSLMSKYNKKSHREYLVSSANAK